MIKEGLTVQLEPNTVLFPAPPWQWLQKPQRLPGQVFVEMLDKNVIELVSNLNTVGQTQWWSPLPIVWLYKLYLYFIPDSMFAGQTMGGGTNQSFAVFGMDIWNSTWRQTLRLPNCNLPFPL